MNPPRVQADDSIDFLIATPKACSATEAARVLLRRIEEAKADVAAKGQFSGPKGRARLLALYDRAADDLKGRINKRGRP